MRTFKFRAWDKDDQALIYSDRFVGLDDFFYAADKNNWDIMQYTGLEDKQGKAIYEGDIVDHDYGRYKIIWEAGYYQTECIEKIGTEPFMFNRELLLESLPDSFTVIGNIYKNPELL